MVVVSRGGSAGASCTGGLTAGGLSSLSAVTPVVTDDLTGSEGIPDDDAPSVEFSSSTDSGSFTTISSSVGNEEAIPVDESSASSLTALDSVTAGLSAREASSPGEESSTWTAPWPSESLACAESVGGEPGEDGLFRPRRRPRIIVSSSRQGSRASYSPAPIARSSILPMFHVKHECLVGRSKGRADPDRPSGQIRTLARPLSASSLPRQPNSSAATPGLRCGRSRVHVRPLPETRHSSIRGPLRWRHHGTGGALRPSNRARALPLLGWPSPTAPETMALGRRSIDFTGFGNDLASPSFDDDSRRDSSGAGSMSLTEPIQRWLSVQIPADHPRER